MGCSYKSRRFRAYVKKKIKNSLYFGNYRGPFLRYTGVNAIKLSYKKRMLPKIEYNSSVSTSEWLSKRMEDLCYDDESGAAIIAERIVLLLI